MTLEIAQEIRKHYKDSGTLYGMNGCIDSPKIVALCDAYISLLKEAQDEETRKGSWSVMFDRMEALIRKNHDLQRKLDSVKS